MIQEAYCSFEIAKLLKEKGFHQTKILGQFTTLFVYKINPDSNGEHKLYFQDSERIYNKDKYIAAPTHQLAMRWLREVKDVHIAILHNYGMTPSYWFNWSTGDKSGFYDSDEFYMTYEEATEAALKYALEVLI